MNPHAPLPISFFSIFRTIIRNKSLVLQMVKHDVLARYKGSVFGVLWSFINPLILLVIYTFVFSVVFKARWGGGIDASKSQFAIVLFVAIIVHSLFSETIIRSPILISSNVSYVKKILFPLEILPIVAVGVSLFHASISFLVLFLFVIFTNGFLCLTSIYLPLILIPLLLVALGFSWFLASLGVYLRDVSQPISMLTTVLLFASPVFYPISALPKYIQPWLYLNPLTFIIEQSRSVVLLGHYPNWDGLIIYTFISAVISWAGYIWFQMTRKGFSNVL